MVFYRFYSNMYTTLEYLDLCIEKQKKKKLPKNIFKELKTILLIFCVTFVWMLLFTNAQIFFNIWTDTTLWVDWNKNNIQTDNTISQINKWPSSDTNKEDIDKLIEQYNDAELFSKQTTDTLEESLENKMKDYSFDFYVVPPTNRLVIPKINLDVPIVDSIYKKESDFTQWNFNEELENWVVKYPTTPEPWKSWNTLIFWHTSQEWRQKNPYWTVFSKIPNLEIWDEFSVIRWWKLYTYKIVEKVVVSPKNVDTQYKKYQNWDFLTLMWCYPIWRTDKRMMITAEKINY